MTTDEMLRGLKAGCGRSDMDDYRDRLRRTDWLVRDIAPREARDFIAQHHYAKGSSHTRVYSHGLFRRDDDVTPYGVVIWLPPTRAAAESVNAPEWRRVLALSRMACRPDAPKNAGSFMLARSVDLIRKDGRFVTLLTYADERAGHDGGVYRAANWTYLGRTRPTPAWLEPGTGKQVASQSTKSRTKGKMLSLGYLCVGTFAKHKYVLHLRH